MAGSGLSNLISSEMNAIPEKGQRSSLLLHNSLPPFVDQWKVSKKQ